jgi:hypothetical protein
MILTHTNWLYEANDVNNDPLNPQPGFDADSSDPGDGWTNFSYKNFNADFVARSADNSPRVVQPYQRHNAANQPVTPQAYQRHDVNNDPVPNPAPVPPPS